MRERRGRKRRVGRGVGRKRKVNLIKGRKRGGGTTGRNEQQAKAQERGIIFRVEAKSTHWLVASVRETLEREQ